MNEQKGLINAVKSKYDSVDGRLKEVDRELARLKTPRLYEPLGQAEGRSTPEVKAFDTFLRKGLGGIEPDERKVLVVSDDPSAGYLAPPQISNEILRIAVDYSPLRQIARAVQINRESLEQPKRTGHGDAV